MYPKSSFLYRNTFINLMDDLRAIFNKHKKEKVLVVAREISGEKMKISSSGIKLSDYIQILGHSKVRFEEYPLSCTNEYENFNIIVLLMFPEIPPEANKRESIIEMRDENEYRMTNLRAEMIQAIGRILRGEKHKFIYILPAIDLPLDKSKFTYYRSHTEFRNVLLGVKKIDKKEKLIGIIKNNKYITQETYSKIFGISQWKAGQILNDYLEKKLLKLEIGNRGLKKYFLN